MRKLIYILVIIVVTSCKSSEVYMSRYTNNFIEIIDSINVSEGINLDTNILNWRLVELMNDDSVKVSIYSTYEIIKNTSYIISVTKSDKDSMYYFKYRKE